MNYLLNLKTKWIGIDFWFVSVNWYKRNAPSRSTEVVLNISLVDLNAVDFLNAANQFFVLLLGHFDAEDFALHIQLICIRLFFFLFFFFFLFSSFSQSQSAFPHETRFFSSFSLLFFYCRKLSTLEIWFNLIYFDLIWLK